MVRLQRIVFVQSMLDCEVTEVFPKFPGTMRELKAIRSIHKNPFCNVGKIYKTPRDIAGSAPDHYNKVNITIESNEFFGFAVDIKVMFAL